MTGFLIHSRMTVMLLASKNILILGMIAFLLMSFWSLYSMSFDMNGDMTHCPFMADSQSFCQMSISEHISQWQQFFSMVREKSLLLSLFLLLVFIQVVVGSSTVKAYEKLKHGRFRNYFYRHKPEIKLFDHLALAFSKGIIHPKIYA